MSDASELAALRARVAELEADNGWLKTALRVNLLRHVPSITHAQIDNLLAGPPTQRDVVPFRSEALRAAAGAAEGEHAVRRRIFAAMLDAAAERDA